MSNEIGYEVYAMDKADLLGDTGEVITANTLRSECGMKILRNLYLPFGSGFTEIDMVGVCDEGIFVIENKNYSGKIWGSLEQKIWVADYGLYKSSLNNPVIQNSLHVRCIKSQLNMSKNIYNTVIFNDKVYSLRVKGCAYRLSDFVRKFKLKNWNLISTEVQINVLDSLKKFSDASEEMRQLHVSLLNRRELSS